LEVVPLMEKGIHDVFDGDMENSYMIKDGEEVLGYVCYHETSPKTIWIEYLLAKEPGKGHGVPMVKSLFNLGYERINGSAIYGPHFFWTNVGAVFEDEVEEELYDGTRFSLLRSTFSE